MMLGSLGYATSATPPFFTPDPQQFVTVPATQGGMDSFTVETTESYLQSNLVGQMQYSGQYAGWTQAQWIAALTADAIQRCNAYPASCAGTSPAALGQKYGTLAYQIMQLKGANTPPPPIDNTLNNVAPTPVVVTPQPPIVMINPPTQTVPVTPGQVANGTTGPLGSMPGLTTWLESNWMIVGAGILALAILPSIMGGKR